MNEKWIPVTERLPEGEISKNGFLACDIFEQIWIPKAGIITIKMGEICKTYDAENFDIEEGVDEFLLGQKAIGFGGKIIRVAPREIIADALEKQISPKKPNIWNDDYYDCGLVYYMYDCPYCGKSYEIDDQYDYCPNCGQAIDWEAE